MKKKAAIILLAAFFLLTLAPFVLAAEEAAAEALPGNTGAFIALGAGLCLGIAALGGSIGQGIAIKGALDGIARNPGASGKIMTPMIIGLAMIESLVIYSLVVALLLVFKI
ncbi:MAG: ATP synthase F0 subunit C [Bacteroidetes bacterium]|nr:MAG: ATP synthase F0 subunit C [Bacteroidota bacterium]